MPGTVGVDGGFYHLYGLFSAISKSYIDSQVKLDIFTYIQEWVVFGLFNSKILCTFTHSQSRWLVRESLSREQVNVSLNKLKSLPTE